MLVLALFGAAITSAFAWGFQQCRDDKRRRALEEELSGLRVDSAREAVFRMHDLRCMRDRIPLDRGDRYAPLLFLIAAVNVGLIGYVILKPYG